MDLKQVVEKKGKLIEVDGDSIKYFEIMSIADLDFKYGISDKGWLVCYDNEKTLIKTDNYVILFKLLELPFEELIAELRKNPQFESFKVNEINNLIPLVDMLKISLKMESDYWATLNLEMLLQCEVYDASLVNALMTLHNKKWPSQKLKHKAQTYMSRVRDSYWLKSKFR